MARRSVVGLVLSGLACLGAGPVVRGQTQESGPAPTDVVATVGDSPVFRSELEAVVRRAAAAGSLPGQDPADAAGADRRRWLEAVAIEQLVDERLLRAEIQRERITVGKLEVDTRLEQLRKQVAARGVEWRQFLAQTGRDEGVVREQIGLEIALERLIRPKLTPAVLAAGLERHKRELDGTQLRVSHIVLRPEAARGDEGIAEATARAAAIRREIVQGATTFVDAARRHSAGPSRLRGGDLGWIKRNAPFVDAFSRRAFELAKGDVSKPFLTPFGVHIVQVTEIEPGRIGAEALRPKLETLVAGEVLRGLVVKLRAENPITYGPEVAHFDPATPADGESPRRIVVGDVRPEPPAGP